MACLTCRRLKIRCSGGKPCVRCQRLSKECAYDDGTGGDTTKVVGTPLGQPAPKRPRISSVKSPYADRHETFPIVDQVSPPFSSFTYADHAIEQGEGASSIPRCIMPFPQMMDPLRCGILGEREARTLHAQFVSGAGAHIPLVYEHFEDVQQRSSFLFTVVLSVARISSPLPVDDQSGLLLENLASNYLARSLLSRPATMDDVTATLYMAIWNTTRVVGGGSSSYLTIGHAQRMSKRLRLHESPPLTDAWAVVVELETFDHMYALGYGRPFSGDSMVSRISDAQLVSHPNARLLGTVARWELVPIVRKLVDWAKQARMSVTSMSSLLDEFGQLNDRLDEWHFRWFSPASQLSARATGDLSFTASLANHVRLSLNMIPTQSAHLLSNQDLQTKARRLALTAAIAIVDAFTDPKTTLATAPALAGSILAYAALCLLPVRLAPSGSTNSVPTLGSESEANSFAKSYFDKAIEAMTSDHIDRALLTRVFAGTIQELLVGSGEHHTVGVADGQTRYPPPTESEEIPVLDNFMEFMSAFNGHDMSAGGQLWSELLEP